jgi:hypothetical protein
VSYEGYREFLCSKGHYETRDAYDSDIETCTRCGSPIAYAHSVDQTNGEIDDLPATKPAPKDAIGFEDEWHRDHYDNKYAVAIQLYRPLAEWALLRKPTV